MRVAYLGPAGTFSEDALEVSRFAPEDFHPMACETIPAAIEAVAGGDADRALVPVENSIEGSVRPTLDSLIEQADRVRIAGEYDHEIRSALIARSGIEPDAIEVVISHPQPLAQCALFLRTEMPRAEVRIASSTAAAVRDVAMNEGAWAALAPSRAARLYDCEVIREGIEDEPGNVTRFLWLAPSSAEDPDGIDGTGRGGRWKTSLAFAELGADHPGALVEALLEFSDREINMVRIESRPMRRELGRYRFFIDIEGRTGEAPVDAAIEGLKSKAEWVRILGSYPAG
ncbi:MAG: prephenate dehydratase [Solirubrobacterales bacterium]|nr:prephenate dehydratase [Solirubrobacterales bacterium]HRV59284.1 prephenate dehydratase [Solirubrobacterales bacterium]